MPRFNNVLLVDDDPISLMIYDRIIRLNSFASDVSTCENGSAAINLLTTLKDSVLIPQIIFLDISMPVMNAWDFLAEVEKIKSSLKIIPSIYLLSSSIDPDDYNKAESFALVQGFISKPLTTDILNNINNLNSPVFTRS